MKTRQEEETQMPMVQVITAGSLKAWLAVSCELICRIASSISG